MHSKSTDGKFDARAPRASFSTTANEPSSQASSHLTYRHSHVCSDQMDRSWSNLPRIFTQKAELTTSNHSTEWRQINSAADPRGGLLRCIDRALDIRGLSSISCTIADEGLSTPCARRSTTRSDDDYASKQKAELEGTIHSVGFSIGTFRVASKGYTWLPNSSSPAGVSEAECIPNNLFISDFFDRPDHHQPFQLQPRTSLK